jgi:hypothetical protein
VAVQPDGHTLAAGDFMFFNSECRHRIVRVLGGNCTISGLDLSVSQSGVTLTSAQPGALYQWLDCTTGYTQLAGETSDQYTATTTGNFAVEVNVDGCIDTSACILIENQDFYDLPGYESLTGEVFALPVSAIDTCDGFAYAFAMGGVPPYTYDWFTQTYNENIDFADSICEGFHTLKIIDNIADTVFVDYYVTDSANFYDWYDTTEAYVDTLYIAAENCLVDYALPLDSAGITQLYYLQPDTIPGAELYFIEMTYYQAGNSYLHQDTISLGMDGWYLIDFSVYCPFKSSNNIKTMLLAFDFPLILGLNEPDGKVLITVYPNPGTGIFNVSGISVNSNIFVTNVLGQQIYSGVAKDVAVSIDISSFPAGFYLLRVQSESGPFTVTLVKNQ